MDTLIYIANESQILPLSGAVASYKVRWQPDLLRVFLPRGYVVWIWTQRTLQMQQKEPTTTTSQLVRRPPLGDLTHTRTVGSGGRLACLVSSPNEPRVVQVVHESIPRLTVASLPVQADIRDDILDGQYRYSTGGTSWSSTSSHSTTFSAGGRFGSGFGGGFGGGYSRSYTTSYGGGGASYSTTHTTTYGEPLANQLLRCWSVLYVPFCSRRWFSLTLTRTAG